MSMNMAVLDGSRLRRAWWTTPLIMTGILGATFYAVAVVFVMKTGSYNPGFWYALNQVGWYPLLAAAVAGALGMLWGHTHTSGLKANVAAVNGIRYLPDDHELTKRVHAMAARLDLPPPTVGIMNAVNAYAIGTRIDRAEVVLGVPLIKGLSNEELDAVIGHELGHIVTGDMTRMQYSEGYQRMFGDVFGLVGRILTMAMVSFTKSRNDAQLNAFVGRALTNAGRYILALGGEVLVKGVSRKREFYADAIGASLSSPAAMAGALGKLSTIRAEPARVEQQYAYLMFRGRGGSLFSTHPTIERRQAELSAGSYIKRLPVKTTAQSSTTAAAPTSGNMAY